MGTYLGIDAGAVGLKAALVASGEDATRLVAEIGDGGALRVLRPARDNDCVVLVSPYRRTKGRPLEAARSMLEELKRVAPLDSVAGVTVTGSGGSLLAEPLGALTCNEFQAICRAMDLMHPAVRTVFELGGETSKYIRLEPDPSSGTLGISDYSTNGDCAAGTGAFLDQQAGRLKYAVEDIGDIVAGASRAAQVAGRCSVFAKSDMIHAQQKGFTPPEVLRGLCNAVAVNYKSAVVRGRTPEPPVALIGGVSANFAVVRALAEAFELDDGELRVPEAAESMAAIGAAVIAASSDGGAGAAPDDLGRARQKQKPVRLPMIERLVSRRDSNGDGFVRSAPLTMERVTLLHDRVRPYEFPTDGSVVDAYLGLDIGSVGTKLVLIDGRGDVIHFIFTRTEGRPIEVVTRALGEMFEAVGDRVRVCGVGTTGSGRELIGELVGADSINDEITAHKTGATFVGDLLLGQRPDTIFEIGGQDSKYISLQPGGVDGKDSIVVDFTMNEACAAGTGSFLEERAEELGVSIKGEFAELALSSTAPIKLGERCTVFMERDVNTCMQRGADRDDVIAGLAYSIAYNYINRVVRGRHVGDCVFFQGGTAYNNAVAAAFSMITGKEIIVPPHNAVLGAIGAAMLAREKMEAAQGVSRFRGFDLGKVDYQMREFTCHGCGNQCSVQEFNVEGEKSFWGDKCSDRFRKRAKTERKPVIPDLVALRREMIAADAVSPPEDSRGRIGIPNAMYTLDLLPLWRRFFGDCGFEVVVSGDTTRRTVQLGLDALVAEPCFPITVAHGHVVELIEEGVDAIWLPNILSAQTQFMDNESHVCPWGQTLPFVIRQSPAVRSWSGRILCPRLHPREGAESVRRALVEAVTPLGVKRKVAEKAFEAAWAAQRRFREDYVAAGRQALATLAEGDEPGMILVGRPYNVHDPGVSLSVAKKLRDHYGVNVLPIDALPLDEVDVRDVNENMYWDYGRRILAAAKLAGEHPNLHMIYITNFKCGPDSFVKSFIRPASGKPFLTLQFDGHSNDAGMMTRCEAYLDSKGILRWWREKDSGRVDRSSTDERSTSRKWPTPAPV